MRRGHAGWGGLTALALALAGPASASGAEPPRLETLFPQRAEILLESAGGLARLPLPADVLLRCRSDLSDVRVIDVRGREVPYLVDRGSRAGEIVAESTTLELEVVAVERSMEERGRLPARTRETFAITLPPEARGGTWDLVVRAAAGEFVRRVDVAAIGADGERRVLVERGSIFSLAAHARRRLRVALPALAGERLAVTLEGEEGFYLEPEIVLESRRDLDTLPEARLPLQRVAMRRAKGTTTLLVERPPGIVPDLLEIATTTPSFRREVTVHDRGQADDGTLLARGIIWRVRTVVDAESRELAIARPPGGTTLELRIEDGDSPPLDEPVVVAVLRRPQLVFALEPSSAGEPAGHLLFGGGRAYRPRYDLAALRPALGVASRGEGAEVASHLYDPSALPQASLGASEANPAFDPAPALAFALRPGAELDERRYRLRQELVVPETPEGLVRLSLPLETLARLRPDLADLRVVDGENRQWAYIVERDARTETRPLAVAATRTAQGRSRYELRLPSAPATLDRLILDSPAPFFDRAFYLHATDADGKRALVLEGRLLRRAERPEPVELQIPAQRVTLLELEVANGDDAPLEFASVEARFPLPVLYLAAPAGRYALLLGDEGATAPRYELAAIREVVLAVRSGEGAPGAVVDNPDYSAAARLASRRGWQGAILVAAIAAAVATLAFFTLRLARREGG